MSDSKEINSLYCQKSDIPSVLQYLGWKLKDITIEESSEAGWVRLTRIKVTAPGE